MKLFKSRKTYYIYNPNTLSYEPSYRSKRDKIKSFFQHLSTGIAFGICTFFGMMYLIDSPMETKLRKENKLLQTQYEVLSVRLDNALNVLGDIQQRDEKLYRAIFQAEGIPDAIRKAGIGGTDRYKHLLEMDNSELVVSTSKKLDMLRRQLYVQSSSINELIEIGKTQKTRSQCLPAIQPISNKDLKRTASGYGWRIDPIYRTRKFHAGMDFSAKVGTPIYTTGNGIVTFAGWKQGYGKCIMIDHGFGYETRYAHLSKFKKRVGQRVTRGEEIGEVGNTGKSTGPHLHYEVITKGKNVNPAHYYYMDLTPAEYDEMIQIAENHGQVMD